MRIKKRNTLPKRPLNMAIKFALSTLATTTAASSIAIAATSPATSIATSIGHPSGIVVIENTMIQRSGHILLGELLQELPEVGSDMNLQFNNGGNGETRVNLRGLGCDQTLVLLNGRRWIQGADGCVNVDQIALATVDRIEILDGGASALFGEGAIAGVVNIITRSEFEGAQARAQLGRYLNASDGERQAFDVSIGSQSDRASAYFNASYVRTEPVLAGDRVISSEPQYGTGASFGSSGTPQGRFGFTNPATGTFSGAWTTDPGCDVASQGLNCFRIGDFSFGAPGVGTDRFNFAPANYLLTPLERTNIFTQGRYELTDRVAVSLEASYSGGRSEQQLTPLPLFLGLFGSGRAINIGVGQLNPYNPTGQALPASSWLLGRRMVEAGPRVLAQDTDTYRFGMALDGGFELADRAWQWGLDYVYSSKNANQVRDGHFNLSRIESALSDDCVTGAIVGCVPLNVFGGAGTITHPMLNYIELSAKDASTDTLKTLSGRLGGELLDLPAGPLGFVAGYQWRSEHSSRQPDALVQSGQTTASSSNMAMAASVKTREFYAALAVPLLAEIPGIKRLQLGISARRSDYAGAGTASDQRRYQLNGQTIARRTLLDGQAGTSTAVSLIWQATKHLSFAGRISREQRVPSIAQLHNGALDIFPTFTDPCNGGSAANPDLPGCARVPPGYQQSGIQYRVTAGSNPYLKPERADTWNFGLTYQPSWLDGLNVSVDTYSIEVKDTVRFLGINTIMWACASRLEFCEFVGRLPSGFPIDPNSVLVNDGSEKTSGSDIRLSYEFRPRAAGTFSLNWYGSYLDELSELVRRSSFGSEPAFTRTEFAGTNQGDFAVPRWKSNLGLTWSNNQWDASWRMRYIHHQRERCDAQSFATYTLPPDAPNGGQPYCNLGPDNVGGTDHTLPGGGPDGVFDYRKLGSVTYHDVQLNYHIGDWDTQLTVGVNNLFDKGPPLSLTAFANSFDTSVYETPGRFPYIRVTTDF